MKKIGAFIVIIVLLLIIRGIIVSINHLVANGSITNRLKETVTKKNDESSFLKEKLSFVKSETYIEIEAREKLGFVKEGEHLVLAPTPVISPRVTPTPLTPNWKKWAKLFW